MKIWISKNSEVPVHEQLVTQVTLGIASGDLRAGDKLPSTREMARRFGIHANTVSAAYKVLADRRLTVFRKGSGCYVCEPPDAAAAGDGSIDKLISRFVSEASALGVPLADLRRRLDRMAEGSKHFLVIEPDVNLREILIAEIADATGSETSGVSGDNISADKLGGNMVAAALFDKKEILADLASAGVNCVPLQANSAAGNLRGKDRPAGTELIAIVSAWDRFTAFAKLYLVAAGIDAEAIITRSSSDPDWQRGLEAAAIIICDTVTGKSIAERPGVSVFPIISEASMADLKRAAMCDPDAAAHTL